MYVITRVQLSEIEKLKDFKLMLFFYFDRLSVHRPSVVFRRLANNLSITLDSLQLCIIRLQFAKILGAYSILQWHTYLHRPNGLMA